MENLKEMMKGLPIKLISEDILKGIFPIELKVTILLKEGVIWIALQKIEAKKNV